MKKDERNLENRCCDYARSNGIVAVKLENNGNTGIPDRLFIKDGGKCIFVEFKTKVGYVSKEQLFWKDFIGSNSFICNDYDDFVELLNKSLINAKINC